jgi:hypothetical protein
VVFVTAFAGSVDRLKTTHYLAIMLYQFIKHIPRPDPGTAILGTVHNHGDLGIRFKLGFTDKIVNAAFKVFVFHRYTSDNTDLLYMPRKRTTATPP